MEFLLVDRLQVLVPDRVCLHLPVYCILFQNILNILRMFAYKAYNFKDILMFESYKYAIAFVQDTGLMNCFAL